MLVVALGEPGVPVTGCAAALGPAAARKSVAVIARARDILPLHFMRFLLVLLPLWKEKVLAISAMGGPRRIQGWADGASRGGSL
jgi:hypothetical protein